MRIALLSHASPADSVAGDGIAPEVLVHARALVELGNAVEVFASARCDRGNGGVVRSSEEIDGIPCHRFARDGALRRALVGDGGFGLARVGESLAAASDALAGLRRALRGGDFDVVEVVGDGAAAGLVALCDGIPALVRTDCIWPVDGSAAERLAASRLARIGMAAARAVSVPSFWLRDQLSRRQIHDGAIVVPDAIELPTTGRHATADGSRLFVWCDIDERSVDGLVAAIAASAAAHPDLRIVVAGPRGAETVLAGLKATSDEVEARSVGPTEGDLSAGLPAEPSIGLFWMDRAPVCPAALLAAMASGMPLAARDVDSVREALRDEVDALLISDAESLQSKSLQWKSLQWKSLQSKLHRLLGTASLRTRLARSARQRIATRFHPIECARRRLQAYDFVAAGRNRWITPEGSEAALMLGPDNWFEAWWLSAAERQPTRLLRDDAGRIRLLDLGYDELKVVEGVLVRTWSAGPKDWSAPEWAELRELQAQMLDHFAELLERQDLEDDASQVALVLPPAEHLMFAPDQPAFLLSEVWRLQDDAGYAAWLTAVVKRRDFAVRARENVHLRRIAVEAAKRAPASAIFAALRRIYRDRRCHEQVIYDDREFLAQNEAAETFASGIAEFGLHTPFARTKFPVSRRRKPPKQVSEAPRITVVIPSYRHEEFIRPAVDSCLRQTVKDVRVLVADDQSPDGTVAAAEAIDDPRLQVLVNKKNVGLGASVLAALDRVESPYVALLNSDDLFHPERLERCLEVLEGDSGAALVATGFRTVDNKGVVLTHGTSCAAEIGPKAHGWLRWFEEIARDELKQPEDWVSFEVLLRHNVLATSSNMVFRTDWLRQHMPEASRLKYCLDWQLFLQAAMEGALRMVEEPLLAYRLHDKNTVWFTEGGRADYVFEVNRVVDRVLAQWFERAVEREGAAAAVELLATLLERDVRHHGEADGLALYLSDLVNRHAANQLNPEAEPLVGLAEAALRRNAYARVIEKLGVDPWTLPWRVRTADRWRIEHDVAQGFEARSRSLDLECARLRMELGSNRSETEDLRGLHQRAETELNRIRQQADDERVALREAAKAAAARAQSDFEAARDRYEEALRKEADRRLEEVTRLQTSVDDFAGQVSAREAELAERDRQLADRVSDLEVRDRQLAESARAIAEGDRELMARVTQLEERTRELDRTRQELDAATQSIARLRADLQARQAEILALRSERDQAREETRFEARLRDRAIGSVLAERAEAAARLRSPSWRLGDSVMRRVGVLGAYKTLSSWSRRVGAIARRGWWHVQRRATAAGRARSRTIVFGDSAAGAMLDERVLRWLDLVDGDPDRLLAWTSGLVQETADDVGRGLWLADDARLAAADRAYFNRRNPAAVAELEGLFGTTPWLARAWRGARVAKTTGTGLTIAVGLRSGALSAYAAKLLCGVRFAIVLGDEDLIALQVGPEAASSMLRAADLVVVDCDLLQKTVEQLAGSLPGRSVVRWASKPDIRRAPAAWARRKGVRAFVQWPGAMRADPETLVSGVKQAVALGCDVMLDVVGGLGGGAPGLRRWMAFEDRIAVEGLADRFRLHGDVAPAQRRALLEGSDAVLWIGRSIDGAGLPGQVLEGLAKGKFVVASAVPEILWVPALAEGVGLVEPGDPASLAAVLHELTSDPEPFEARLAACLALMTEHAQMDPGLPWSQKPK